MVHKMNANRISTNGVSTVFDNDESISRLKEAMLNKSNRKAKTIQKVASVEAPKTDIEDSTGRLIIASLNEIPSDFERIGTGFYRQGHHLWQMSPADGGFVLVRKHGEDHVIDYDPEPITKQSNRVIKDRYGKEIKVGSKVIFPLRGKAAAGTVLVISPGVLDIGLGNGVTTACPPGMVECDESIELEENNETETDSGDKNSCDEFEPKINKKPESDYVGPQNSQSGGVGGVAEKTAQSKTPTIPPGSQPESEPESEPEPAQKQKTMDSLFPEEEYPAYDPGQMTSRLVTEIETNKEATIRGANGATLFITKTGDDRYVVYEYKAQFTKFPNVFSSKDLMNLEKNIGGYEVIKGGGRGANRQIHDMMKIAAALYDQANMNALSWRDYWLSVGQKIADAAPAIPKPKMSEEEKRQRRKERAKQRKLERAGLPKGTKLPPKPKTGAAKTDDIAKLKERLRIYEQGIDALQYELNNIEDTDNDMMVADTILNVIDDIGMELEELDEKEEQEINDELSIEKPSTMEDMGFKPQQQERVVVSMKELIPST